MVWAEGYGTSIILPADRQDGDGRNYIVIGEDVPPEITNRFTAAVVFRNGEISQQQYGFSYWVLGINRDGALEICGLLYQDVSSGQGIYQYYRQTILTVAPPIGMDKQPTLQLGYNPTYDGSYNEKGVDVRVDATTTTFRHTQWIVIVRSDSSYLWQVPQNGTWNILPGCDINVLNVPDGHVLEVEFKTGIFHLTSGGFCHLGLVMEGGTEGSPTNVEDSQTVGGNADIWTKAHLTGHRKGTGGTIRFYIQANSQSGGPHDIRTTPGGSLTVRYRLWRPVAV